MNTNILSFVLRAKNRIKLLNVLQDGQKVSAQIEKQTGMYKSHISRTLRELTEKKLIRCVNSKDRNFRFYELTSEGKKVILQVDKILKDIEKQ